MNRYTTKGFKYEADTPMARLQELEDKIEDGVLKEVSHGMKNIFEKAIYAYGAEAQLNVAIEELSELIKEICKHKRGESNLVAIIEEMADVYIMLEQMQMIFDLGSTVIPDAMQKKIDRLEKRLNKESKDTENNEIVRCIECKHLMFSDCYGECSKAYKGIVHPNDYCGKGEKK